MKLKTNFIKKLLFGTLLFSYVACGDNKSESVKEAETTSTKSSITNEVSSTSSMNAYDSSASNMKMESNSDAGLDKNPSTLSKTATRECLMGDAWRGCGYLGARQATYNVRPDGTWEFSVNYCCNYARCYKSGSRASTAKGAVSHEEYSLSSDGQCLELVNRQRF